MALDWLDFPVLSLLVPGLLVSITATHSPQTCNGQLWLADTASLGLETDRWLVQDRGARHARVHDQPPRRVPQAQGRGRQLRAPQPRPFQVWEIISTFLHVYTVFYWSGTPLGKRLLREGSRWWMLITTRARTWRRTSSWARVRPATRAPGSPSCWATQRRRRPASASPPPGVSPATIAATSNKTQSHGKIQQSDCLLFFLFFIFCCLNYITTRKSLVL